MVYSSLVTTHLLLFSCTLHRLCISLLSRGRLLCSPCRDSVLLQKIHPSECDFQSWKNASWEWNFELKATQGNSSKPEATKWEMWRFLLNSLFLKTVIQLNMNIPSPFSCFSSAGSSTLSLWSAPFWKMRGKCQSSVTWAVLWTILKKKKKKKNPKHI